MMKHQRLTPEAEDPMETTANQSSARRKQEIVPLTFASLQQQTAMVTCIRSESVKMADGRLVVNNVSCSSVLEMSNVSRVSSE